mmetsp:Transcript_4416/g.7309  ORF Transcript_4416/g.7309 Transcript_4416/m.7309 type:complete len:232 (+) Transcript_4416:49-744(+)
MGHAGWACWTVLCLSSYVGHAEPQATAKDRVIILTDQSFESSVASGIWLVDIYATWCSHCRQLEPAWRTLADQLAGEPDMHVAKVDGPQNKQIMARLGVDSFPSIYLMREGNTYVYSGPRNLQAIKEFASTGYKTAPALPFYKSPNNMVGRLVGRLYSIPNALWEAYKHVREEHGWSDLGILVSVLAVPMVTGIITICALDYYVRGHNTGEHELPPLVAALPIPQAAAPHG